MGTRGGEGISSSSNGSSAGGSGTRRSDVRAVAPAMKRQQRQRQKLCCSSSGGGSGGGGAGGSSSAAAAVAAAPAARGSRVAEASTQHQLLHEGRGSGSGAPAAPTVQVQLGVGHHAGVVDPSLVLLAERDLRRLLVQPDAKACGKRRRRDTGEEPPPGRGSGRGRPGRPHPQLLLQPLLLPCTACLQGPSSARPPRTQPLPPLRPVRPLEGPLPGTHARTPAPTLQLVLDQLLVRDGLQAVQHDDDEVAGAGGGDDLAGEGGAAAQGVRLRAQAVERPARVGWTNANVSVKCQRAATPTARPRSNSGAAVKTCTASSGPHAAPPNSAAAPLPTTGSHQAPPCSCPPAAHGPCRLLLPR